MRLLKLIGMLLVIAGLAPLAQAAPPAGLQPVQGKVVWVDFWASWCVPCQTEAPVIEALWPEYRDRGYVFLGVNMWDQPEDARQFVKQYRLSFPVVADEARAVYVEYGVQGLPTAFFIAPGGAVRSQFTGPIDERTLRGLLNEIAPGGRP